MRQLACTLFLAPFIGLLSALPAFADADAGRDSLSRRWGIGWDGSVGFSSYPFYSGGLAVQRQMTPHWGLEVVVNTTIYGSDDEDDGRDSRSDDRYGSSQGTSLETSDVTNDAWTVRAIAFHEKRLTDWFAVGPYFGAGYGYERYESEGKELSADVSGNEIRNDSRDYSATRREHHWIFSAGVRPSFTFDDRFVLFSRLGFTATWNDAQETVTTRRRRVRQTGSDAPEIEESFERREADDDGWNLRAFGQELGPGAVLAFVVLF